MAIDWTAVKKKAQQQDAAYNAKATQGADNRAAYQTIAKSKAAAAQIKANPSMLTAKITPITMAQTAAGVAKGSIPNAFQNQKESGFERANDIVSSGASSLVGGAANAVQLATTGKYSPSGIISRGIDKIRGTNYTEQNAANQKSFANKMMDNSLLYSQNAKRGISKAGQVGVDIGSAATQIGLMALTGGVAGSLGAGSEATGALTKGLMAIQQAGQGAHDAEKTGAGEGTQALYGLLQGATAYATEGISNVGALGKVFGNGAVDSKFEQASANAISKFIKSDVGRAAANRLATGAEAGIGEALEQNFQDALTPVYQRLTYDKNAKLNAEDMIYNGLVAGAVGGIVGSAGKNNLKALETENDARAAESRAASAAAAKAPPVTNTAPNLSQVAPNLVRPTQNIAQEATQAPISEVTNKTVTDTAKEVNASTVQQAKPDSQKKAQFDVISASNPITDNYHVGIRSANDIKTFDEAINDEESFVYGDFSKEDAQKALADGKVTVYSSKPIGEVGAFVSTSKNMASDYAGDGKVYEKTIPLTDVAWINGDEGQYAGKINSQSTIFPENSIGAKITTPKSNIPLKTSETSKSETPNAVGAKSAEFGYKEAPTQNRFAENTFTEEEVANTPSLENSHKVNPDAYVDRNAQERYDSDYEGEKADLFGSKQKWDDADTKLAIMILENETAKARKTGEWGEVAKLNKKYAAMGTTWGQEGRQRQRFANTPTEIISEAAATLSEIEAEEKGKTRTSKEIAQDNKVKEQSNDVGKDVAEIVKDTAKKISNSYSNHTRKAKFSNLKTIEGNQAGEPFTFEYEDKVGEALANSIEKSVTTKPKQQTTFLKEIANQLKALAKETMPEKEKSATTKVTATDRLKDYLANKDFYSNAWSLAQDELRRRYANDPDMLASLESFTNSTIGFRGNPSDRNTIMIRSLVNSAIESGETKQVLRLQETLGFTKTADNIANDLINKTGATGTDAEIIRAAASQYVNDVLATSELDATKTVNAKVKSAMHDIGVTISDTVTKNAKEKAGISKAVTDLLVNKYGLGTADASNVANVVNEHFNKLVSDATQKKLESIFNKTNTTANVKPFMQKLTEMINMGVFDNSQYSEAAAEKLFGLKVQESGITSEKFKGLLKTIAEKADKLDNIKQGDTASVVSLIKDLNKIRKTTGMFSEETSAQMSGWLDYASKLPDGEAFLRDVAAQQIRNVASDYQKTSVLNAIKNYRVMGMLSKVVTILRNLTANNIFDPVESLSTNAGVPLDILLSKYTKTRSTSVDKSWFSSAKRKGSIDGFVKSAIQVGLDADVTNSSSKYETHSGRTFKMTGNPVERFLSTWAKWENYGLQSTDEFQKGGIAAETQRGIDQLKSKGLVAKDALTGRAEEVAKQRTFQNDGALATAMLKGRDALNVFGLKDKRGGSLGAGDVAVPFAKVPANIVAQGGNYSPAGFIKAIGNLGKTLAQAHEGTLTADQQAKAVTDFGRATTGSAGIAMFTALALKGIIKVAGADDKDKEALQTSEGQRGTQFNISALNRWINGRSADWQDGDTLMSIGFLEPINAQMAMGAMIADAYKDDEKVGLADVANANVSSVFQSVLDLPAMSQISDLVNGYKYSSSDKTSGKLGDAALGYGASQASSFLIPNIIGGVATGMDGTVRNTYTSKNPLKQATDSIVSKIPGLRNTLPAKQDSYGNDRQTTGNKLLDTLNANILPGQIGKYSTSEVNQELYRLDTKYPVRNAPNTIKSNKLTYALTLDEKAKYLKTMGQTENSLMQAMISSSAYKSMTDTQKSDALNNLMLYATDKANREFVTSKGAKYTSEKYEKVYEAEQQGISPTAYFTYKTKLDEINDDGTVTELETARALEKTSLSQSEKGKLWQNQNVKFSAEKNPYSGTLAQLGLAPSKTIEIMEAFDTIDDAIGKNYVKADKGPGAAQVKAAYLIQWLSRQGYNANQRAAITDVFTTWQMIPVKKISKKATAFVNVNPMP